MSWWQVALIVLTAIVVGLLVGRLLSYLILRLLKKPFVKRRRTEAVVKEQRKFTAPALLAEIENNRRIATEPRTDKLLPFQTGVWDTNPDEVHTLPANLRQELTQAYVDMRLANSIAWLSVELGRRSPDLDENYRKLCTSIAARLDRVKPLIEHNTFPRQLTKPALAPEKVIAIRPERGLIPLTEAVIYLLVIAAAQAVTAFYVTPWGILYHIAILTVIIVRSALVDEHLHRRLLLPLALVPLLRIISLSVPLADIPEILLYYLSYAPLLVAAVVVVGVLGYTPGQVGLSLRRFPVQLAVGLTGIVFGLTEYFILVPEPMIAELTLHEVWLPALILGCTGFMGEFVFRGVLQSSSVQAFGGWGIVYVSLLFAVTHIGFLPVIGLIFVFVVALFFGWVVRKTGSLLGVALASGICNIALYLIVPFVF